MSPLKVGKSWAVEMSWLFREVPAVLFTLYPIPFTLYPLAGTSGLSPELPGTSGNFPAVPGTPWDSGESPGISALGSEGGRGCRGLDVLFGGRWCRSQVASLR